MATMKNKDTTGDMFQAAGEAAPFSFILGEAEMPAAIDYDAGKPDKNQTELFAENLLYIEDTPF